MPETPCCDLYFVLVVSRCFPSHRILSRDRRCIETAKYSAPEDPCCVSLNLGDQILDVDGRFNEVVLMESGVPITPVQRPLPEVLRVAEPSDRGTSPIRIVLWSPGRPTLNDRHRPASVSSPSTSLRCSTNSAMVRNASVLPTLQELLARLHGVNDLPSTSSVTTPISQGSDLVEGLIPDGVAASRIAKSFWPESSITGRRLASI